MAARHFRGDADVLIAFDMVQQRIRDFLKVRTSYDVLPLSFRLIVLDTTLLVKKSLVTLIQNGEQECIRKGSLSS